MPYYHGIRVTENNSATRAIADVATSTIGMVCTADDADAATFPLNEAVHLEDLAAAIGKAGDDGTLARSLDAIADQANAPVVVVRVAEGETTAETSANVVGTTTAGGELTGMQALLGAESQLGLRPRILGAPGLDGESVAAAFATVAQKLRGFAYCAAQGDTLGELSAYRQNFGQREMMLIWPEFSDFDGSAIARALGLRSKIDQQTGWHKTLSNVAVNGVTGLARPVPFSILANDVTLASQLNDADITTLARIDGYRFWGNRTCSDDPIYAFESTVRTSYALQDAIAEGLVWAIDKPIVPGLIRDILESINAKFRELKADGRIIGAEASYNSADNPAEALKAGKLVIDYEFTDCAPAEAIGLRPQISDRFYSQLLAA
ncbi:phage tail sheath subtilisin-like domain-containing protein [Altererythrobacter sp. CC-YST694]|uniref:phage tail sheath subtilisin-like domain-containing protein n=1 Tax=Altererythrobacter sp. CC-YST694 TaxID=2755038 RepID=UPI001D027A2E|nr:phage tail sheath subtilisin-like domain-containing protein [Altererythrobacter sp. CC-YST694]MCB5423949.1 phage tail sheath subtilisin-like domain-containing protein [Altererythrobacter sp. CC-YST694]